MMKKLFWPSTILVGVALLTAPGCSIAGDRELERYGRFFENVQDALAPDLKATFTNRRIVTTAKGLVVEDSFVLEFRGKKLPSSFYYSLGKGGLGEREVRKRLNTDDLVDRTGSGMGRLDVIEGLRTKNNSVGVQMKKGKGSRYLSIWASDISSDILLYRIDDQDGNPKVSGEFLDPWSVFSTDYPEILNFKYVEEHKAENPDSKALIERLDRLFQELEF